MYEDTSEKYFLEGLRAARGGLGEQACPYPYNEIYEGTDVAAICAPVNWREGWQFGKLVMIQELRRSMTGEVQSAVENLFRHQSEYCDACHDVNRGLMKAGIKYFTGMKKRDHISQTITHSKQYFLLRDIKIEFYLPWRPNEIPYYFKLFDRLLDDEGWLRKLVERYGDRHGIRGAWHDYVHGEPISSLIPPQYR